VQILSITLDDNHYPSEAAVILTRAEMEFMVRTTGRHNHETANAVVEEGYKASHSIYQTLSGHLFNRFWDNGVDGAIHREEDEDQA
jgi:hypothetical protein